MSVNTENPRPIPTQKYGWAFRLEILTSLALIVASVSTITGQFRAPRANTATKAKLAVPTEPLALSTAAWKGAPTARVAVLEFSDFQCPYCARFATETLPAIEAEYVKTGRVRFGFRHFPLAKIHPLATTAAEASRCFGRQDRFWEAHDRMYANPKRLATPDLIGLASELRIDADSFGTCLSGQEADQIQRDIEEARRLKVERTPSFFIGTIDPAGNLRVRETLVGAQPFSAFKTSLDSLLR